MKKTKLAPKFWITLVIFSLIGQIAWVVENMYFNVFIYKMFRAGAGDISLMVAASAIVATLTTIFIGALSDKMGKRKIFICGGYVIWGITIIAFAFIRTDIISSVFAVTASAASVCITLVIIMDCIMTFFGSSANDACFNAWLTDSTDNTNRGSAEGINAMMPLVAILVVFGGFMGFDLDLPESWVTIFLIIGITVSVIGILGFFLIKEPVIDKSGNTGYFANIIYGFRPSVMRKTPVLYFSLLAFAVFNISIQIFMPYLILYYEVSLGMENYVLIMAPAIIVAALVTLFYGKFYDRVHFRVAVIPALIILAAGYVILFLFRNTALVFIGSLFMMSGYLAGMAVFGAMIRDHTPVNRAGMFQGLRIVCQVLIPGVIGPAIGAAVLKNAEMIVNSDGTTSFIPNANIFVSALIAECCIIPLLLLIFHFLKKKESVHES